MNIKFSIMLTDKKYDTDKQVEVQSSNGYSRGGAIVKFVRPVGKCSNRSRKVSGFTGKEVSEKVARVIERWYSPIVIYYEINGTVIGSNSKQNALKEYWRICDMKDHGKIFEVNQKQ
jgi:hypothetical protein